MQSLTEKGGGTFGGIKLLLCENPLPPLEEAIAAAQLRALGVKTFPTETYFFLADFSPHNATHLAEQLKNRGILMKPLNDPLLGEGYMRVTTALPEDNARFMTVIQQLLA
jgi:histidinol-phosphate/aromatic aminotransferase/cobyric acid decarboxylase-like protein